MANKKRGEEVQHVHHWSESSIIIGALLLLTLLSTLTGYAVTQLAGYQFTQQLSIQPTGEYSATETLTPLGHIAPATTTTNELLPLSKTSAPTTEYPQGNYSTLREGTLIGYITSTPSNLTPGIKSIPFAVPTPSVTYGQLGFITSYDGSKGLHYINVYYIPGNSEVTNITFDLHHWKYYQSLSSADMTTWKARGNIIDITTTTIAPTDSLLFPGNEKKTTYTTKGTWSSTGETGWQDNPNSKVCYYRNPTTNQDDTEYYVTCDTIQSKTFFARGKTILLTGGGYLPEQSGDSYGRYDDTSLRHGFALGTITGVNAQGTRVPIPVHRPNLRDK